MKIGLIGKDNYKGLGTLTEEYVRHLPFTRVMCVNSNRRRIKDALYVSDILQHLRVFIQGLDLLVVLEYSNPNIFKIAKEAGVPCILKVNYEFLNPNMPETPTTFLCSSTLNYEKVPFGNKVLLPDPVNTQLIPYRPIRRLKTLLHNGGTIGLGDANCTEEVINAMKYVKSDVRLIVNCQKKPKICYGDNVEFRHRTVENYWEMFDEGDVFVMPQRFRATSLPIQEAMASGMPVITTNKKPFNEFCEFLVEPFSTTVVKEYIEIDMFHVKPKDIAAKIDEVAAMDLTDYGKKAREKAEAISWEKLTPEYIKLFEKTIDTEG